MLEKIIRIGKNYEIPQDTLENCIEKLFQREFKKPMKLHPILKKNFSEKELNLIFCNAIREPEYSSAWVFNFAETFNFSTLSEILRLVRLALPNAVIGHYDDINNIELTANLENETINIQKCDSNKKALPMEHLTKEEYLLLIQKSLNCK